jgi:hypothetical protein
MGVYGLLGATGRGIAMNEQSQKVKYLVNNNEAAHSLIMNLWQFVVVWDDSVDRDKTLSSGEINAAMLWAFLGISDNTFYDKHQEILKPAFYKMIAMWMVANEFEKSGDRSKVEQAYYMRCSPYDVFSLIVLLASGFAKLLESEAYFRSLAPEDSLAKYMREHLGEQYGLA